MKSWLKGGVIALFVYFILELIDLFILKIIFSNIIGAKGSGILIYPLFFLGFNSEYLAIFLFGSLFYFLIGAIIGLIVGKIKSKKGVIRK